MRRKGGVVVPAVIVCIALVWGSVSSAWAGAGFRPLLAEMPDKGAVAPAPVQTIINAVAPKELVVLLEVAVKLSMLFLGMVPVGPTSMTADQAARIAQAEFDH